MAKIKKLFCRSVQKKWSANVYFLRRKHEFDSKQLEYISDKNSKKTYNDIIKSKKEDITCMPFARKISELTEIPFCVVTSLLSDFFDLITITMSKGKDVYFSDFGRFICSKKEGDALISFKPTKDVLLTIKELSEERRKRQNSIQNNNADF